MDALTAVTKDAPELIAELRQVVRKKYQYELSIIEENIHDYIDPDWKGTRSELRGEILFHLQAHVGVIKPDEERVAAGPPSTRELLMESIHMGDPIVKFNGRGVLEIFAYKYVDGMHYGGLFASPDNIIWTNEPKWTEDDDKEQAEEFILTLHEMHNNEPRKESHDFYPIKKS